MLINQLPLLPLRPAQVDLWVLEPSSLQGEAEVSWFRSLLGTEELSRVDALHFAKERHSRLVACALVRCALSRYVRIPPGTWRFRKSQHGKPRVENPGLNLEFNLSHTTDKVVCAVTRVRAVGVDVERIRFQRSPALLGSVHLTVEEYGELTRHGKIARLRRFFDYWTLKESFVKAAGTGILHVPDQNSFLPPPRTTGVLASVGYSSQCHWRSWLWPPGPQHRLAVTLSATPDDEIIFRTFHCFPPPLFSM